MMFEDYWIQEKKLNEMFIRNSGEKIKVERDYFGGIKKSSMLQDNMEAQIYLADFISDFQADYLDDF